MEESPSVSEQVRYIHVNNSGMNDYQAFVIQWPRSSLDTAIDQLSMVDKRHQLLHPHQDSLLVHRGSLPCMILLHLAPYWYPSGALASVRFWSAFGPLGPRTYLYQIQPIPTFCARFVRLSTHM